MASRIVITGAPGSGKTECIERLKANPAFSGFLFFDEVARQLLIETPTIRKDWTAFHLEIYRRQDEQERLASGLSFISDRGTLDAFAFHPDAINAVGTTINREYARYDLVIQLGSAAGLGDEYYRADAIRTETTAQALTLERALADIWRNHTGYHFLPAQADYESKYRSFLNLLITELRPNLLDNSTIASSIHGKRPYNLPKQDFSV